MNINYHRLDTNQGLLVTRHKQGFRLVKESDAAMSACPTVAALFALPIPAYFYDRDSNFVDVNEHCAVLVAAESAADVQGKKPDNFCSREFSDKIIAIDDAVIRNETMSLMEEVGFRADGTLIQCISLKLPWYVDDKVAGLLGFSINTDNASLSEFTTRMSALLATGLLHGSSPFMAISLMPKMQHHDIYLSRREMQVLSHLVRGRTAKEIGIQLGLSKRTVEHYVEHIKSKSKCGSRSELIDKFYHEFSNS